MWGALTVSLVEITQRPQDNVRGSGSVSCWDYPETPRQCEGLWQCLLLRLPRDPKTMWGALAVSLVEITQRPQDNVRGSGSVSCWDYPETPRQCEGLWQCLLLRLPRDPKTMWGALAVSLVEIAQRPQDNVRGSGSVSCWDCPETPRQCEGLWQCLLLRLPRDPKTMWGALTVSLVEITQRPQDNVRGSDSVSCWDYPETPRQCEGLWQCLLLRLPRDPKTMWGALAVSLVEITQRPQDNVRGSDSVSCWDYPETPRQCEGLWQCLLLRLLRDPKTMWGALTVSLVEITQRPQDNVRGSGSVSCWDYPETPRQCEGLWQCLLLRLPRDPKTMWGALAVSLVEITQRPQDNVRGSDSVSCWDYPETPRQCEGLWQCLLLRLPRDPKTMWGALTVSLVEITQRPQDNVRGSGSVSCWDYPETPRQCEGLWQCLLLRLPRDPKTMWGALTVSLVEITQRPQDNVRGSDVSCWNDQEITMTMWGALTMSLVEITKRPRDNVRGSSRVLAMLLLVSANMFMWDFPKRNFGVVVFLTQLQTPVWVFWRRVSSPKYEKCWLQSSWRQSPCAEHISWLGIRNKNNNNNPNNKLGDISADSDTNMKRSASLLHDEACCTTFMK